MSCADAPVIVELIGRAMNQDEGTQAAATLSTHFQCRKHGIDDGRTYHVLRYHGKVSGIVGLHFYAWGPPENVWLAWFAVAPEIRGQGWGSHLLDFAEGEARSRGFTKLFVETYSTPEFAGARRFYRRRGFAEAGYVQGYLPCGGDMIVFIKEIAHEA